MAASRILKTEKRRKPLHGVQLQATDEAGRGLPVNDTTDGHERGSAPPTNGRLGPRFVCMVIPCHSSFLCFERDPRDVNPRNSISNSSNVTIRGGSGKGFIATRMVEKQVTIDV